MKGSSREYGRLISHMFRDEFDCSFVTSFACYTFSARIDMIRMFWISAAHGHLLTPHGLLSKIVRAAIDFREP